MQRQSPDSTTRRAAAPPARRPRHAVFKGLLVALVVAGCQPDQAGDGGSEGMFGLFKGKGAKLASTVAPEVGAALKRETAFPAQVAPLPTADYDHCKPRRVAGTPPQAKFVGDDFEGKTVSGYRVGAHGGHPPLALVNVSGLQSHLEIWELASDADPSFARQRTLQVDPKQGGWAATRALDAACLPGDRLAIGLFYADPRTQHALYTYDVAANAFHKVGDAVLDSSGGSPGRVFEIWPVARDAAMVLWHSGEVRVQAEVYVREHDHLLLTSARHPKGLEVLKLGLDDGNVERWAMVGHTLWLETVDARHIEKPATFVWSLDLSKVL